MVGNNSLLKTHKLKKYCNHAVFPEHVKRQRSIASKQIAIRSLTPSSTVFTIKGIMLVIFLVSLSITFLQRKNKIKEIGKGSANIGETKSANPKNCCHQKTLQIDQAIAVKISSAIHVQVITTINQGTHVVVFSIRDVVTKVYNKRCLKSTA
ncbi:unnamed protein product [Brugia pahangi]|uniref:Transmembrane protein n=1 Tax=Brugia pahangi TaxID=6280 RepID=A0A0N4TIM3_BRUPA|nr:unnamed protein product [Brugia pahangi]